MFVKAFLLSAINYKYFISSDELNEEKNNIPFPYAEEISWKLMNLFIQLIYDWDRFTCTYVRRTRELLAELTATRVRSLVLLILACLMLHVDDTFFRYFCRVGGPLMQKDAKTINAPRLNEDGHS